MPTTTDGRGTPGAGATWLSSYRPRRAGGGPAPGGDPSAVWELCDGRHSVREIAGAVSRPEPEVAAAVRRLHRLGRLETIEQAVLRGLVEFHGPRLHDLRVADICTGDYFTAVVLSDGSQGAAINFNNVSGPHRTTFDYLGYDAGLLEQTRADGLLMDSVLRQPTLDYLGQSVRVAILNALSREALTPARLGEHGLRLADGYLDLASFVRRGDTVTMVGCTGNYSCPEIGKLQFLKTVYFSDFEYTGPFKSGIQDCINRFFVQPEKVVLSDGSQNQAICAAADVVVIIADTLCTNTLDELLRWSADARAVLITGRSYVMDPTHLFFRGAKGTTTQRIVQPDFIGFVRAKLRRGEYGFTDSLVQCFERMYVVES
jgi:uncharacterized protein (DUF4213/DUF364 family)